MTEASGPVIYVVDDDREQRESLGWLIESVNLNVETYASARKFLEAFNPARPGCLVLDVRMPGMSGLDLQKRLAEDHSELPIIIITAHADVPMAVRAMRTGAIDVVQKPFNDQILLDRIQRALHEGEDRRAKRAARTSMLERIGTLTPRESEIMDLVVVGKTTKQIANQLRISPKTVEAHRGNLMEKMGASSAADLVRQTMIARRE